MPDNITSTVRLFADDTIMYLTIKSQSDSQQLQLDLDALGKWENNWMMNFHSDKCNVLTITKKRKPIKHQYTLHGHILEQVTSAKYSGTLRQLSGKFC
jgi:hypothetical protein